MLYPQGGTPDFKWRGWSNWDQNQNPKKSLGLPTKPKKMFASTPKKSHVEFANLKNFQKALNDIAWKIKTLEIECLYLFTHHTIWSYHESS